MNVRYHKYGCPNQNPLCQDGTKIREGETCDCEIRNESTPRPILPNRLSLEMIDQLTLIWAQSNVNSFSPVAVDKFVSSLAVLRMELGKIQ